MQKEQLITKKAVSTVEALLSVATFSFLALALASTLAYSVNSTKSFSLRNRAVYLADEGLEATRSIRNENFASLADGPHGLSIASNKWEFSGTQETIESFTRVVNISTVDSTTKQITSTITWTTDSGTDNVTLISYLTDWLRNVPIGVVGFPNPSSEGTLDLAGNDDGIKVEWKGDYAYVIRSSGSPNFAVINIVDQDNPTLAASLTLTNASNSMFLSGNYIYITSTDNSGELKIIDITNPLSPNLVTTYDISGTADAIDIHVQNNTAYLLRANSSLNELVILDVTDPLTPVLRGSLNISNPRAITVLGNYAYVGTTSNTQEIIVVNISNPLAPTQVATINLAGNSDITALASFGNTLLAGQTRDMRIVDVTNPLAAVQLSTYDSGPSGTIKDIRLNADNSIAFVIGDSPGGDFNAVDISNLSAPSEISSLDVSGTLNGIAHDADRNRVYGVTNSNTEEFVVIIPNP